MKSEIDQQYWAEWGKPLGLKLLGWTEQSRARFVDKATGRTVAVSKFTMHGNVSFDFLDRLRAELMRHRNDA